MISICHRHLGDERLRPPRALLHAGLLGGNVADDDQSLAEAGGCGVGRIFPDLPFVPFADDLDLHVLSLQEVAVGGESGEAWL